MRSFCKAKIWEKSEGIFLLIAVKLSRTWSTEGRSSGLAVLRCLDIFLWK